nr:unnamed protein product [Callosobruchus analis]
MHIDECIMLWYVVNKKKKKLNRRRTLWVHPMVQLRENKGAFNSLFQDLLRSFEFFKLFSHVYKSHSMNDMAFWRPNCSKTTQLFVIYCLLEVHLTKIRNLLVVNLTLIIDY